MNASERAFKELVESTGFRVLRNGWPDFAIMDERGELFSAVELKCGSDKLSRQQEDMHYALRAADVPVLVIQEWEIAKYIEGLRRIRHQRDEAECKRNNLGRVVPLISARKNMYELMRDGAWPPLTITPEVG